MLVSRGTLPHLNIGPVFAPDAGGAAAAVGGNDSPAGGAAAPAGGAGGAGAAGANQGGAAAPPAFADTLPEDIRADAVFRDIKNLEGLARSYHGAAKMVGLDKGQIVAIPANDDAQAWEKTYTQLGRPEKADGYKIAPPGEGKTYSDSDKAFQSQILPVLHKAGLSQRQLDVILPEWNRMAAEAGAASDARTEAAKTEAAGALKTEWGAAYDQNIDLAKDTIAHYAGELGLGDSLVADLEASKLGNSPALAKLFAHLGGQLREDGVLKGRADGGATLQSPTEALQTINGLQADKDFMKRYMSKSDPGHKEAVARMEALYQQAYPDAAA